jgi:protein-S-isoprenylcysteine O-methyltransferase Ste14
MSKRIRSTKKEKNMIALKTSLFMVLVPGLLLGALPAWLMTSDPALFSFGTFRWLAIPPWAAGAAVILWCAWAFTVCGQGTPSPTDPPKRLVVSGLYAHVRNPIYDAAVIFLLGHVLWHPTPAVLLMPPIVMVSSCLFVVLYEEPHLRRTFGREYERYCSCVPRWIPRFRVSKS